uniref:Uncharacterized protein n=1 Tax=Panagrolaimus superbus TaxID=310955 RepID=A0A914ZDN6_9BILA
MNQVKHPFQLYKIHIFDGDETKLVPGMRVRISTGAIFTLDSIPFPGSTEPQAKKLNLKAGQKFRKKVRQLVESHDKYLKVIAKMPYKRNTPIAVEE